MKVPPSFHVAVFVGSVVGSEEKCTVSLLSTRNPLGSRLICCPWITMGEPPTVNVRSPTTASEPLCITGSLELPSVMVTGVCLEVVMRVMLPSPAGLPEFGGATIGSGMSLGSEF
jgi:hypothetical protein